MNKKDHITDITKLSRVELEEMIAREQKLLGNKTFIARLPDKGSKIRKFCDKLSSELEKHYSVDHAAGQLANMQIGTTDALNSLEWTRKGVPDTDQQTNPITENSDNSELHILASSRVNVKQIQIIQPDPSLITEQDLKELEDSSQKINDDLDVYSKNIITFESNQKTSAVLKFKPFYTTKTDVHNPTKEKHRKRLTEEITSATPPALQHEQTVKLSLYDSIQLQMKQKENLEKIQHQNAAERMQRINKVLKNHGFETNLPVQPNEQFSKFFTKYREDNSDSDDSSTEGIDSDLEVHDDYDEPRGGGVVVYNH